MVTVALTLNLIRMALRPSDICCDQSLITVKVILKQSEDLVNNFTRNYSDTFIGRNKFS